MTFPDDYGLCKCGCGQPVHLAKQTKSKLGHIKGQPVRFLPGHQNRGKQHIFSEEHKHKIGLSKTGEKNHNWKGDAVSQRTAISRTLRGFPIKPCEICGENQKRIDRHHKDGNTRNNSPENIQYLCRKCHMITDGRMEKVRAMAIRNQPRAVSLRWIKR